jgi:hypothetical protein
MDTLEDYYMIGTYDDAMDAFVPTEAERWDDYQNDLEVLDVRSCQQRHTNQQEEKRLMTVTEKEMIAAANSNKKSRAHQNSHVAGFPICRIQFIRNLLNSAFGELNF